MKTLNKALFLSMLFPLIISCDDILEDDITDDTVQIIFPTENVVIDGNTVQFSWQYLKGADDYRIQIIKSNQTFEVDSLVTSNIFHYVLNAGTYQWRVRGENFAYATAYTFPVNFTVETSNDLSNQTVIQLTPSGNLYTNNSNFIFTWEKVTNANSYSFELIKNLSGEQTLIQEPGITASNFSVEPSVFDEDAEYKWKVKAVNATSETFYAQRSLFIDRVLPNQPALTSPLDQSTATTTAVFNWTNGADSGNVKSAITNMVQISSDANFNSLTHTANTSNNTYQYLFSNIGTYYWRVKAIDAAGNESDFSIVRSVVVQ